MKIIKQSVEIIPQFAGHEGMLKHIELCGRVCYKSEDKISDKSANSFVEMLKERGHLSVLEHGTVYLHTYSLDVKSTPFAKVFDYSRVIFIYGVMGYFVAQNCAKRCYLVPFWEILFLKRIKKDIKKR